MLTLNNLQPAKGSTKHSKRLGRGNASRGTYSGKGQKGQRARSGGRHGLKMLGLKQIIRRIPKQRGFKSIYDKPAIINLDDLEQNFVNGEVVDVKILRDKDLVKNIKYGVKVLGSGKVTKALQVKAVGFSKSAAAAIIKAGGKAIVVK